MQLKTFIVDASLVASDVNLATECTQLFQRNHGFITFVIANEGVANAYVETARDITDGVLSSEVCEAAKTITVGPFEWPDNVPWLHSLVGAKCRISPNWEE